MGFGVCVVSTAGVILELPVVVPVHLFQEGNIHKRKKFDRLGVEDSLSDTLVRVVGIICESGCLRETGRQEEGDDRGRGKRKRGRRKRKGGSKEEKGRWTVVGDRIEGRRSPKGVVKGIRKVLGIHYCQKTMYVKSK